MQIATTFSIDNIQIFKQQLLRWANQFSSCCFLDNHGYQSPWQVQECLVAAGAKQIINLTAGQALPALQQFLDTNAGQWIFGHLGYGLHAETENVPQTKSSNIGFEDLTFFVPAVLVQLSDSKASILADSTADAEHFFAEITAQPTAIVTTPANNKSYAPLMSRQQYLQTIANLQQHIQRGDCYEINFCQEFVGHDYQINPIDLYQRLSGLSPNPFACFYKQQQSILACASPERFIRKTNEVILSQPIKGTAIRHLQNPAADDAEKQRLRLNAKDQRENVMIVDLVRNDLAKVCREGSVKVEELFGIYTYPQVHQMISTVIGNLRPQVSFTDILRATFPMGSMTGAPKKRVLQLIDNYEQSARGLFSGSVGYIQPNGDFDFNVVIRSVQYNMHSQQLSFHVGSGITWYSQPQLEYEECMWKASAIQQVLQKTGK